MVANLMAREASGQTGAATGDGTVAPVEKVADNLYVIQAQGGNVVVFVAGQGVVLVDPQNFSNPQTMLDRVKAITSKPITHVIRTHSHSTMSNQQFPAAVEIVTHEISAAIMKDVAKLTNGAREGLADRTFKKNATVLSGKDAIDLYYFGWAHTAGDTFVVFRRLRTMYAGDVFAKKTFPIIDTAVGGSGIAYPNTFSNASVGIKGVDSVITGQATGGTSVQTWQDFLDYGEFNRRLLDHAERAVRTRRSAQEAAKDFVLPMKFSAYRASGIDGRGTEAHLSDLMIEVGTKPSSRGGSKPPNKTQMILLCLLIECG